MIRFSSEVEEALANRRAAVALETSVVAQGLPFPANLETAKSCEQAVRDGGAVPAAIGVIEGEVWVGLTADQMRRLAEDPDRMKIGSRDMAPALVRRASGGTTVSATCELAVSAGIRVFATGGIGGVHRGSSAHFDVSQDLFAISKSPVAVICAGAKSILDLPNTLEALESLGVLVVGVGTNEFPSFYSRRSGLRLDHRVDGVESAAEMMQARFDRLGQGGMVFALPVPERDALLSDEVEAQIQAAVALADRNGIRGHALTPFLLAEVARRTGGKSLAANRALLINTARFAGELAVADARLRSVRS